ncbi:cytochrome P450 9e2-like [Pieris brassicae]|uniref:cytochrome P450 9e2-like n=1 Tax=Pieris brassicae TaxID=7116 RepID=UPI001E6622B8|nr:cytochrome P450 9e2-like [Pieris brassicae]
MELSTGTKNFLIFIQEDWKLLLCLTVLFILYFHYTSSFDYFENKGIKFMKPVIFLGNLGPRVFGKKSFHELQIDIYKHFKGNPFGGFFEGRRPVLYIFDPDLIKSVMIRDFDHFTDRNTLGSREPKYISRSVLNLKGAEWKAVRSIMTPTFSSARLKNILPLIHSCADQMVDFLKLYENKDVDMKDCMGHFTLEVISVTAFGIKSDALTKENAEFVMIAEKFNYMPLYKRYFIFFVLIFVPGLFKYLNISFLNSKTMSKLNEILQVTKAERRVSSIKHNDFLQLMLDAAQKEKEQVKDKEELHLDDGTIDAQIIIFLLAGFETSSSLLSFAIHVLAIRPDLQEKLRKHVIEVTEGKEINYDLLTELDYLEAFLNETLRMYPPVAKVDRIVTKPYVLPGSSVSLEVGRMVSIPIYALHMDQEIYPDPQEFKPERFLKENGFRTSHLFLPFGAGPRVCIGLRFAMMSTKMAMVSLLKNFNFKICSKTQNPVQFDKRALLLKASKGLYVRVEKI